jgi:hypothetical protein
VHHTIQRRERDQKLEVVDDAASRSSPWVS